VVPGGVDIAIVSPNVSSCSLRKFTTQPVVGEKGLLAREPFSQRAVIESILPHKERMDCFAALAMTAKHTFATSPRDAPEPLINLSPF
jgi:hypothetical protein